MNTLSVFLNFHENNKLTIIIFLKKSSEPLLLFTILNYYRIL